MEFLKQLLAQSGLLTEDTRKEIETQIDSYVVSLQEQTRAEVVAELHEQWATERGILIESLDLQVQDLLAEHIDEFRESVKQYRDLEVQYAAQLVEARSELQEQFESDREDLIEQLDAYIEVQLAEELEELRVGIDAALADSRGRRIFEAFAEEFRQFYVADDSVEGKLVETEQRLEDALVALDEAEQRNSALLREQKMMEVLEPLTGQARETMAAILKRTETEKLEEMFNSMVSHVLKESVSSSEKEEGKTVLAEGKQGKLSGVAKTGNVAPNLITEQLDRQNFKPVGTSLSENAISPELSQLKRLAGIS